MTRTRMVLLVFAGLMLATWVGAQDKPAATDKPDTAPSQRQGRRDRNPDQFRQMFADRIKEMLSVNDEEWKAMQPKLEKVLQLSMQSRGGGMMMMGRRGGNRGDQPGANNPMMDNPVAKASQELRTTLDNKDSKPEEIAAKLTALREAKEKAKTELVTAQKELRELLTQRQEATLVMWGLLD